MGRNHYSYEKRQQEIKKKKKREEKALKKQDKDSGVTDDAAEYLAMIRGEPFGEDAEGEEGEESDSETAETDPEVS
jgi:hypothetical protein